MSLVVVVDKSVLEACVAGVGSVLSEGAGLEGLGPPSAFWKGESSSYKPKIKGVRDMTEAFMNRDMNRKMWRCRMWRKEEDFF